MAGGFCLEITVFTAMATLDLEFISTYIVPVLIYTAILSILTIPIIFGLARRFCRDEWFEKACMAFGAATGNTSTGLALVRAVDPESQCSAGDTHGVYSALMSWKDVFVGLAPMWLMSGIGLTSAWAWPLWSDSQQPDLSSLEEREQTHNKLKKSRQYPVYLAQKALCPIDRVLLQ